jgi:holo-ACP synthase/triphosphoribosyl-dephospho-CoA synthase
MAVAAEGIRVKGLGLYIEQTHPLGRLFDIDVIEGGGKISRAGLGLEERKCLVCGGGAFACGRSRAHKAEELAGAVLDTMENFLRKKLEKIISAAAIRALMGEAAITPKPGLVDRANNGAHRDMNFFTFIDSAAAVLPYFTECALAGFESAPAPEGPGSPAALFDSLRLGGKIAEIEMKEATGGVNTHRGIIFSLGILSAAFGRLYRGEENPPLDRIFDLCQSMTCRLGEDFSRVPPEGAALSHGESLYLRHGLRGIRGEVSRGFPSVRNFSYPALLRMLDQGHSLNDSGVAAFLALLAHTEDTNIVHRSGPEELDSIQKNTAAFLAAKPSAEEILQKAAEMDSEFIKLNISPGGCADLLAATIFLHGLCTQ